MQVPFIIFSKKSCADIRPCIVENYGLIRYEYPFINALCVEVPEENIFRIKKHRLVSMMVKDGAVKKFSHFPKKSKSHSHTINPINRGGEGVTIAIIDTGFAPHYDLLKPTSRLLAFKDFISNKVSPYDDDGHGTHVAGIALGNGYSCAGNICGTAPLANLVAIKALDETGSGSSSDILAAMQWVSDNKERYNIRVLNLSLGIPFEADNFPDPLVMGTTALVMRGITVVTAAGNSGPEPFTISSPGINPLAITVGAYGPTGIPDFSSRGPVPFGINKPDVLAPGVDIVSLDASNSKGYIAQSGTSMACPYVSGLVASLISTNPTLTPKQIKKIIYKLAEPIYGIPQNVQGRGCL